MSRTNEVPFSSVLSGADRALLAKQHVRFDEWTYALDPVQIHADRLLAVASAFYGRKLSGPAEILDHARMLMGLQGINAVPEIASTSGFSTLYQVDPFHVPVVYEAAQRATVQERVHTVLRKVGVKARDIDLVVAATSMPIQPNYAQQWMEAAGLRLSTPLVRVAMACNSSGYALGQILGGAYDQIFAERVSGWKTGRTARVLIIALDDGNRFGKSDALSPQLFSTGISTLYLPYNPANPEVMRQSTLVNVFERDGADQLRAVRTYDRWSDQEREGLLTTPYLLSPDNDRAVDMSPRAGVYFIRYAFAVAKRVLAEFVEQGGHVQDIAHVIVHHPSLGIFLDLGKKLQTLGIAKEKIQWVINEGNVPVATIPMALGRQLDTIRAGEYVLVLSFGAGGGYTGQIVRAGQIR